MVLSKDLFLSDLIAGNYSQGRLQALGVDFAI